MLSGKVTTIVLLGLPGNSTLCAPFGVHKQTAVMLKRVEAVQLGQAGFRDFLVGICVRRLKGKRDDNKEVYSVDTICNSAG